MSSLGVVRLGLFAVVVVEQSILSVLEVAGTILPLALLFFTTIYRGISPAVMWSDGVLAALVISLFQPQSIASYIVLSWVLACGALQYLKNKEAQATSVVVLYQFVVLGSIVGATVLIDLVSGRAGVSRYYVASIFVLMCVVAVASLVHYGITYVIRRYA